MYEYVSDILRAMKIDPKNVILIRHAPQNKHFRAAKEAGFIKEYTSMQVTGFAKDRDYLMVFIGEDTTLARFFAMYYIVTVCPSRTGRVPAGYPDKSEETAEGDYMELREVPLPLDLSGFVIDWGKGVKMWHQYAEREKPVLEIFR